MAANQDQTTTDEGSQRASILDTVEANPKAYGRWTDEETRQLLELVKSGMAWSEISAKLGRTAGALKSQARRVAFEEVHGRSLPDRRTPQRRGKPWSEAELQQLVDLIATASSWDEVGETLQRDPTTCKRRAEADALQRLIDSAGSDPDADHGSTPTTSTK